MPIDVSYTERSLADAVRDVTCLEGPEAKRKRKAYLLKL